MLPNSERLLRFAEEIDRTITLDVRAGSLWNVTRPIYQDLRKRVSQPLTLDTAAGLSRQLSGEPGTVLITTGFVSLPDYPNGETDGPLGAAALARAIEQEFNCTPVFLVEESVRPVLVATCEAIGLSLSTQPQSGGARILRMADTGPLTQARANELLEEIRPRAIIAIEKVGRNSEDQYMSGGGDDISASTLAADLVVEAAQSQDILTVGIADLGNEIGMGGHSDIVMKHVRNGRLIATKIATTHLAWGTTSNWAAFGVVACLAALRRRPDLLHSAEIEAEMIRASIAAGARVPSLGDSPHASHAVDSIPLETDLAILQLLHEQIRWTNSWPSEL